MYRNRCRDTFSAQLCSWIIIIMIVIAGALLGARNSFHLPICNMWILCETTKGTLHTRVHRSTFHMSICLHICWGTIKPLLLRRKSTHDPSRMNCSIFDAVFADAKRITIFFGSVMFNMFIWSGHGEYGRLTLPPEPARGRLASYRTAEEENAFGRVNRGVASCEVSFWGSYSYSFK